MRNESGFNLIELMISMAVFGLLTGGVFGVLFRTQATFELQRADQDVRQQARVSLDLVSTELRMAGYDIGSLTEPVSRAGTTVLQFVADVDDGDAGAPCGVAFETATDGGAERLTYELNGTDLLRSVDCWDGSSWSSELTDQLVAQNVQHSSALFRYFDEDGVQIVPAGTELSSTQRADVRSVAIDFSLLDPTNLVDGRPAAFEITGRVYLPNLH